MRALVIGASGFIGLNLVERLQARGVEVRATRRKHTATIFLRKRGVELADASLEEPDKLRAAMQGCDAVFLAGAHYPRYSTDLPSALEYGVRGVANACEAARKAGVSRLVYTSSIATLAKVSRRPACEDDVRAEPPTDSVYRAVKWAMEREVERAACAELSVVTILPGGCVGPWDLRLGTSGLLVALIRGELPFIVDGMACIADVGDVAELHVRALCGQAKRYCIAPHCVPFDALCAEIVRRYGGVVPPSMTPARARREADRAESIAAKTRARVAFPRELVDVISTGQRISSERARKELDLQFAPLAETLDRAHGFFERYGYLAARRGHGGNISGQPRL